MALVGKYASMEGKAKTPHLTVGDYRTQRMTCAACAHRVEKKVAMESVDAVLMNNRLSDVNPTPDKQGCGVRSVLRT